MEKILSYFIIIFIIFITSGSSDLSNDKNLIIGAWFIFFSIYLYLVKMIEYFFVYLTGLFILISVIYFIKNGGYDTVTYIGFLIKIHLSYFCREICKEHFSKYFIQTIYILTCISLPLFVIQLINFDFLYQLNSHVLGIAEGTEPISSSFVFAMIPIHETRNSGFMWEPGAFAAILALTIYINTFHKGETLFSTKNIVFILAILTTQSTMGFLALLIPIGFAVQNAIVAHKALNQLAIVVVPTLIIMFILLFTQIDFLSAKIFDQVASVDEEMAFVEEGNRDGFVVATTRITSILLDMETIKQYPFLGIGIDMRTTGLDKLAAGNMTVTACGLTNLLLRFGFIGFFIYVYLLYKQSFFEQKAHRIGWVCLILIILTSNELSASSFLHLFIF